MLLIFGGVEERDGPLTCLLPEPGKLLLPLPEFGPVAPEKLISLRRVVPEPPS